MRFEMGLSGLKLICHLLHFSAFHSVDIADPQCHVQCQTRRYSTYITPSPLSIYRQEGLTVNTQTQTVRSWLQREGKKTGY